MGSARRLGMTASWAFQSLAFHRTRTLLTVAAVGLATALAAEHSRLPVRGTSDPSVTTSIPWRYQILVTGKGCPHEAATLILRGGSIPMYIREEVYRHIAEQPEVKDATRFFMQTVPDRGESSHQLYVGIDENFLALKPGVEFQRGKWFSGALADEAILGFNVAEYRRLGIGDTIGVKGRTFSVRGILDKLGTPGRWNGLPAPGGEPGPVRAAGPPHRDRNPPARHGRCRPLHRTSVRHSVAAGGADVPGAGGDPQHPEGSAGPAAGLRGGLPRRRPHGGVQRRPHHGERADSGNGGAAGAGMPGLDPLPARLGRVPAAQPGRRGRRSGAHPGAAGGRRVGRALHPHLRSGGNGGGREPGNPPRQRRRRRGSLSSRGSLSRPQVLPRFSPDFDPGGAA